jgi:predicted nucleic acid-binding protein
VPDAWDTTVASRAHGGGRHAPLLEAHLRAGALVALPAPTVQEIMRGLHARPTQEGDIDLRPGWFAGLLAHSLVKVVPFAATGGVLAGRLLALLPHPPSGRHRRPGTRAQQRAAWALDVQIASCAFAGGYGVLTENVADFAVLRDAIVQLVPAVPPLAVTDARGLARTP